MNDCFGVFRFLFLPEKQTKFNKEEHIASDQVPSAQIITHSSSPDE